MTTELNHPAAPSEPSRGFQLLEHTADVGLRAWGPSQAEALRQAAFGLCELLFAPRPQMEPATAITKLSLQGQTPEELLVSWLNELLYLCSSRQLIPTSITLQTPAELELQARIEYRKPEKFAMNTEIKAVTYHQALLSRQGEVWQARVFLDL